MENIIECCQVTKRYRDVIPVNAVDLSVRKGEAAAISGESGSGKSTLLRLIAGLESPQEGQIFLMGKKWDSREPLFQRGIAMVFQEPALWNHMTVGQNVMFGMQGRNRSQKKELAQYLMEQLNIADLWRRYPYEISGGQAKRVSLARACGADRPVLLLDEPLSNLDEGSKAAALTLLQKEYKGKHTILYVTHSLDETADLCDTWYRMEQGHLKRER